MEAENIEFGNNTFDALSVSMALHHIADVDKALNEMQRVVKPGGWIIVNELYSDNLSPAQKVHRLYHHFRSTIDRLIGVSHNFTFKRQEIIDLVNHSGIDLIEVFDNQDNSIKNDPEKIEERVSKMKANLVQIEGKPEYTSLKPQIEEFRQKAIKFGIQTAPRLVIIGKVK
jgi:ubiquinone/menaquinone biosynthesis C-methylase UbiE